ncbi:hypothetical protein ADEAN_000269700 [Angomonas deanei]|uniref:Uncharacterized protein n=1 Tax=Angomonas deanei TaxID=59799 RepID=A0A7G2CB36_9TRYP|nr:hypothetical protein ADEAN_000269700 [Angomonas deanei]
MSKKNSLGNRMDDFHMAGGNRHNMSGNNVHHMNPANNLNFNMNGFTNMGGMPMPFVPELHNPAMNPFLSMNPNGNYIFNPMMQPFLPGSTNVLPQTRMQVPHTTSSTTNTFSGLYPHAAPFVPSSAKGPNSSPLPMHGAKPSEEGTIFAGGGGIAATPTEGGIASPFTSADSLWAFNNNNNNPPTNNSYSNNNNNAMHRGPSNIVNVPPEVHKVPPQSDPAIINFFPEMQTTSINVFRHGNGLYTALNGVPVQISLNPLPVQSMPSGGGTATSSSGRHSPHSSVPSTPSSHHQSMPPSFQKSTPDDGVNLGMFVFQP